MTLGKSPISKTCSGWQMARYLSTEKETIVSTEEYEALKQEATHVYVLHSRKMRKIEHIETPVNVEVQDLKGNFYPCQELIPVSLSFEYLS